MSTYSRYSSTLSSPRLSSYTPRQYTGSNYSSSSYSSSYKPPLSSSSYRSTVPTYLGSSSYSSTGTRRSSTGNFYTNSLKNTNSLGSSYLSNSGSTSNLSGNYLKSSSTNKISNSFLTSPSTASTLGNSYIGTKSLGSSYYSTAKNDLPIRRNSTLDSTSLKSIYGTSGEIKTSLSCGKTEESKQKVGLQNLGNTCYMNSVIQCLFHTPPFLDYLLRGSYKADINYSSPSQGRLIKAFADLFENMKNSRSSISPNELLNEFLKLVPSFRGAKQQDAQEFLRLFMNGLNDDIQRNKYRSSKRNYCGDSWQKCQESDDSMVVDIFGGQLRSTLQCTICKNESIAYDPFLDLSLPIPEGSSVSLRQCFTQFSNTEILDDQNKVYCEICKTKNRMSKKFEVSKFPKVLVIHLKRLSNSGFVRKNSTMVDIPFTLSKLSGFSSRNCLRDYELYAVVEHFGSTCSSGHYTATCKDLPAKEKDWYTFSDSSVRKTTNVISNNSYLLFYIQV